VRRVALLASLLALTCAGAALAAPGDPQKRHNAADMAKAKSIVLKAADLGTGWKSSPSSGSSSGTPHCKGFQPDESDLVETGTANSPDFSKGLRYVLSAAALYKTAGQAQTSWNRIVKPGLVGCFASLLTKGASGGGVKTTATSKGSLHTPKLAPRQASYRVGFATVNQGVKLSGSIDLFLLGEGRADALMISVSFGTPPTADELRIARLMAGRLG
jgi:hypothetical protein